MDFDSRRLTGPNFYCASPAAIIEVDLPASGRTDLLRRWQLAVEDLHTALGRAQPEIAWRTHDRGQSLYVTAPIDSLYSTIELNELALESVMPGSKNMDLKELTHTLAQKFSDEANLVLLQLQQMAGERGVAFLWDDDQISLGYGRRSKTWNVGSLPDPSEVDWQALQSVPLALITGTNGKSTTTRLCGHILQAAGLNAGYCSTDGIWVGRECLDSGDYSGPGGARTVLRNNSVDVAVLEVARGGMLRRGLGVNQADVALITNVAEDHLGEYGVNTLDELIEAKFVVRRAVAAQGTLILNADDAGIVRFAAGLDQELCWFSLDPDNSVLLEQISKMKPVFTVNNGNLCLIDVDGRRTDLCVVAEIPITMQGIAAYNVSNVLAASAVCWHMGIGLDAIRSGLKGFGRDQQDNPGRGNLFQIKGIRIMVDFAHNPHGLNSVIDAVARLPARRRLVMLGHAGDRSDEDIRALTRACARLRPECVVVYELLDYLRGREEGEIPQVITETLADCGIDDQSVLNADSPAHGTELAMKWAKAGDFLLLLVLADREKVFTLIEEFSSIVVKNDSNRSFKD